MRPSPEQITKAPSYINCIKERELDLRGHKISAIANMGAAPNNDAIDFTDNDITQLGGFPLFPRLRTLFVGENRVANIQASLSSTIPNLTTLVLSKNKIAELADLDPLQGMKKLVYLSLVENPVTFKEHYRYWVIWRIPTVRFLDYAKVKDTERERATELFGTAEKPTELATKIMGIVSKGFTVPNGQAEKRKRILTEEEKGRFEKVIRRAKTLEEVAKLTKDFEEGRVPPDIDAMET